MKHLIYLGFFILLTTNFSAQTTRDYPFKVEKNGQGKQAIILIPGFASSGAVWDETQSVYEKQFTCYTLTMAGFAGVPAAPQPNFEHWKNEIAAYIKEKNIKKPILIGHSMGGGLAMALAADYPDLIKKIIVVDALPCLAALSNPNFKAQDSPDCSSAIKRISALTDEEFYAMQKSMMPQLLQNQEKLATVVNWSVESDRTTFATMYCDFMNTDLRKKIKKIECPTLVLLESNFKRIKDLIENQYKNLATANLQYANKGLHFIMYDDKDWYFEQLANFLTID